MGKTLYIDGSFGISGDMTVAALIDLGASQEKLEKVLKSLNVDGYDYKISRKNSYSIAGCDFDVHLHEEEHCHEEHYHDHEEHGHHHKHNDMHTHEHTHEHVHEHEHSHDHSHEHHHMHRHLKDVYEIIDSGDMTNKARDLAKKIFLIVAEAEAKAHGCSVDEVHFHEVGAVDSIVDIVSVAVLLDDLQVENCIVKNLADGHGFVNCQHGKLPVPVPAVLNIAEKHGIILHTSDTEGEMITPTGLAIVAAIKTSDSLPTSYRILKSGIGLGKRDFGRANFLRIMLIEPTVDDKQVYVLDTNIDDSTGEEMGLVMEKLLKAGAKDVCFVPCFMKKNRPSYILKVLATADLISEIEDIIFFNTSTIGIRKYPVDRSCMDRSNISVDTKYGKIDVKKCSWKNITKYYPEYESVKSIAENANKSFRDIYNLAKSKAAGNDK